MAESGLKEAIEGLEKLKFAVVLMLVLMVFIVVAIIVATFVVASTRSVIPLAVAFLLMASFAYSPWLMARAYGMFHKVFSLRDSYRWAQRVNGACGMFPNLLRRFASQLWRLYYV